VKVFIDSNIPMYVAGSEHPHRDPSRRLLAKVQSGEIEGYTSVEVLQEILYRYSALRRLDLAREVYDIFVQICPVVFDVTLAETDRARDLLLEVTGISARDAIHAAVMLNRDVEWIASFDGGFDRVPGIRRMELSINDSA
jgi:predicted nucleic acid-binding protein